MKLNEGIIDVHVHAHGGCTVDGFLRNALDHISAAGVDKENLLCVKHGRSACVTEPNAILAKALYPDKFSVMGNPTFVIEEFGTDAAGAAAQVQDFLDAVTEELFQRKTLSYKDLELIRKGVSDQKSA